MLVNLNGASIRLVTTYMRYRHILTDRDSLKLVDMNDFIGYYSAAYKGQVRNAGKKTVIEAACLIAISLDCSNVVNSAWECLLHPYDDTDMLWLGWNEMDEGEIYRLVAAEYADIVRRIQE